ncbi:hypothetical protein KP509_06G081900 [Ceratopteris richardii]|uniref:Uncharacterized protein n=1 Tax=Ceratopteris richardii TaxID=49495 RepID=A0A8T2UPQ7_CERRI|nr:hypothetical protein KP509_06G081900 [Ceratopteris richardii]
MEHERATRLTSKLEAVLHKLDDLIITMRRLLFASFCRLGSRVLSMKVPGQKLLMNDKVGLNGVDLHCRNKFLHDPHVAGLKSFKRLRCSDGQVLKYIHRKGCFLKRFIGFFSR